MPSLNRHRAGRIAQKVGGQFEDMLFNISRSQGICCVRIPDGCKMYRGPKGYALKRIPTPFDYVLFYKGLSIVLDTKTTEGKTFTHSAITPHQLNELCKCDPHVFRSGYLVWHREIDRVVFYSARLLYQLQQRKSLSVDDGINLGPLIKINISRLFTDISTRPIDSQHQSTE